MAATSPVPHRRNADSNHRLAELLQAVGWRPETLARKVNAALAPYSTRQLHPKTPYRWINRGEVPHTPVPDLVVRVLSQALGQPLDFHQIWPERAARSRSCLTADDGLDVPWTYQGLLRLLEGWPHTMLARRAFIALSGAAVTASAWEWMDAPAPTTIARTAAAGGRVSQETLTLIDTIVAAAQQMDDQHGAAGAGFVSDQFSCVSRLLRQASYDTATGRRLCAALAQLAQTAGFMAHENLQDAAAQRWYLTALHAAQCANDHALAASILALMSNQQADIPGKTSQALQLAAAAQKAATRGPAAVRSLIAARSSLAYAAAGDPSGFQRTRDQSLQALDHADSHPDHTPRWARYVTRTELDAITGRGMVTVAQHITGRHRQQLLTSATTLLHDRALTPSPANQRSALRHLTWLGLAHAHAGNLDQAGEAARAAVQQAPQITSPRCRHLIGDLRDTLAAHARHAPAIRPLLDDLNHTI